ncbi:MAG: transglycosylase SLT domain-containing protein [Acidobacteriota bacterium]|nr:MAG: transglycosylase SLT domain-containing protein [Acidobacteriota bacterium]
MIKSFFKTSLTFLSVYCILSVSLFAQVTGETRTNEVRNAESNIRKLLEDAGRSFNEGMLAYEDGNFAEAGAKFNKSVETFLYSTINIQKEARLQGCYNQLIETVYLIEFPSETKLPQIRNLVATCGWNISNEKADRLVSLVRSALSKTPNTAVAANGTAVPRDLQARVGFNTQEFEPSPLDELSKLQLTPEELDVNNPVAQQQYVYIQQAVANRSLGFSFQVHPMIQQYINYYQGRGRKTMEVGLYRSGMFMRMARRIFREEGVPENVAWLGQVESAWKPSAMSHMAASGLWQFIPGTGARYGLRRTAYVDERNSFEEATRASARYLKFLANRYGGNWELAMAGYNCGEGNVDRAIRRAGVANFWAAYPFLPQETRNYVPNILATILIANNPQQYGFGHIRPAAPLVYDRVRVPPSTNLAIIAQASDTTVQYLRYLNPHLRTNQTPPEPYVINVPLNKGNEVVAVFRRMPATNINNNNLANAASGETWQTISNKTGVPVAELMAANPGMRTPQGKVFVPVRGNNVAATSFTRPTNAPAPAAAPGVRTVKARAGDTVRKVAERNGVDATELAKFNGLLPNSVLPAGREIKIPAK